MLWPFGPIWRPMRRKRRDTVDLRWFTRRSWTTSWYPQGIDTGIWDGRPALAVSWFRQDRRGNHLASRIALIDPKRSSHLDVALSIEDDDGALVPARIHAGGLAWFEHRLFVAATGQGIWEFDLSDLRRVSGGLARRLRGGSDRGLPAAALVAVRSRVHAVPLRCSFIGRVFDDAGRPLGRVLIGEYRTDDRGRIGEFSIPEDGAGGFVGRLEFSPGIPRMQGAVRWGAQHFISQSDLMLPGKLWSGPREDLRRHDVTLPVGPEDLALDPEAGVLWSLGEHPWRRVVRGIPFARIGLPERRP
ncbi:hypothetical protein [Microbacterium sp.]|uniref:hypothetical protein n=1 Tax=Microbacterium sp. TaxID=51671 RepID=UPI00281196BF|nr:hypothetical protein [Microbacterium sp.]